MPDQPQSPNSNRISAILQDLAQQRGQQGAPAPVGGPAPVNLPVAAPQAPRPAMPATPPATMVAPSPRPVVMPSAPAGAIPPPRPATPPAPRELPVVTPPRPATPPVPPTPAPVAPVVAPKPVAPAAPVAPVQPPLTSELRTMAGDIGQIQVGRPTTGVRPIAPVAPVGSPPAPVVVAPARPATPQIVIPTETGSGKGRKMLIFGVGALLVVGILAYVASPFGGSGDVVQETPTPTATVAATLIPQVKKLTSYFPTPAVVVEVPSDISAFDLFVKIYATAQPQGGLATPVTITMTGAPLTVLDVMDVVSKSWGAAMKSFAGPDQILLSYGQKEHFDSAGAPDTSAPVSPGNIFIVEVTDASIANQFISGKIELNVRDECTGFNSGSYREVPIRYRNCPFADNAEDFAIVLASNNKNYFVSTDSRESMFFVINQLMQ